MSSQAVIRQRRLKIELIKFCGGKCEICGFIGCPASYDFHHKDSMDKELIMTNKSCTTKIAAPGNVIRRNSANKLSIGPHV